MVAKHQKLLLGNNVPGKCLHAHMQHFFSPSPAIEKKSAESAFFIQKSKTCHETVEFTSQTEQNTKNYTWATMPLASTFTPTWNICSALAALSRKNPLSQHFFIQKSKTCHETVEFSSQWWQNTKNYSWATRPLASAWPTCNISSALAPLSRKNSLSQHFFMQKSKTCYEIVEFTSQWGQNTKNYSWATMPLASDFWPTCNISSALAPLSRKNSPSQHLFIQKSKTCHETVEFTSQWFFIHQKKSKTCHETVEPMGAKHQKLLGNCLWQVPSRPHAIFLQP